MPLSFPPSIYATVSPAAYLHANLTSEKAIRANGRKPSDFRQPVINTNSLRHCFGSAVLRTGDTAVVCGVRGEILRTEDIANPPAIDIDDEEQDESEQLRLLVPNIEMATGASPAFLPGNPPSSLAQTLSQRMYNLLHSTRLIHTPDLRVLYKASKDMEDEMEEPDVEPETEIKAYWTLYIDILFISLDGNPFDAAWGAMLAALKNTVLPQAWWDADMEQVICSGQAANARPLTLRGLPVPVTFAVFDTRRTTRLGKEEREWVLADPDAFEEEVCEETVTITVDGTKLQSIEKSGGTIISKEDMRRLATTAQKRWKEWQSILK